MSKRIKDTDYLFITTFIRARESKLLTKEKMERMIDAKTCEEAAKVLEDCGYDGISSGGIASLDAKLSEKRAKIIDELANLVPNRSLVDAFRLKYDYHNAKVLIKAEATGVDGFKLLSASGRIPADELSDIFYNESTSSLPKIFANAVADAKDTLARTGNPQLADFILDKAYFSEISEFSKNSGSKFFEGYCRLMIDSANLRTVVRSLRIGKDAAFLRTVLIDGGNVKPEKIIDAVISQKALDSIFSGSLLEAASKEAEAAINGAKLTAFEKVCDNALIAYLGKAKSISFGEAVLIAYIGAIENECLAARIIMTGKLAGLAPEVIRERLRESYV